MNSAMLVALIGSILLLSCTAATAATRLSSITHPGYNRHSRYLQQEDVCDASDVRDYLIEVLGPSFAADSLYKNVAFPLDDGTDRFARLPIDSLALDLIKFQLLISGNAPFVQEEQSFGRNGEHTEEILSQHDLLNQFWKISDEGPPILLVGLHSEILEGNLELAVATLASIEGFVFGISITETISAVAKDVAAAIETELPNGYSSSALTKEAFFINRKGIVGFEESSVILVGDGFLDFLVSLGLGEVGNDIIHAHEFSHAIQFILDLEDAGGDINVYDANRKANRSPESTRQGELEADAMGAYALAHEQGRNFEVPLLVKVTKSAFAIGDCGVTNLGHHGTPKQRECATLWGADEGLDMKGEPVSSREFRALFLQNLDLILALDSSVCSLTDDIAGSSSPMPATASAPTPTLPITASPTPTKDTSSATLSATVGIPAHPFRLLLSIMAPYATACAFLLW